MSKTTMTARTRAGILAVGTAVLVGIGSCSVPVPEFTPPPQDAEVYPVLDEERLDEVLAEVNETLAKADEESDRDELSPRIDGRAKQMRGWEYALAKAMKKADADDPYTPQALSTDPAVYVIAATEEWPRNVMVITDPPDEGNAPMLLTLAQETPRDQYSLQGWVRLAPGVTTPQVNAAVTGSKQIEDDADGLLLSPEQTIEAYAEWLNKGKKAKHAKKFAKDQYKEIIDSELKGLKESLDVAGKVKQTTKPAGSVTAIETFDGGAIVFGGLRSQQVYEKTVDDAKMRVGTMVAAKNGGDANVDTKLTAVYDHMIAFYVPPEDSEEKISLLGAERVLSSVKEPEE